MSKQYAMISSRIRTRSAGTIATAAIMTLLCCSNVLGQRTSHVNVTPTFRWPQTWDAMTSANRTAKGQLQAFLSAVWRETAGTSAEPLQMSQARFAQLGNTGICLAATFGGRFPWGLDVICPASGGYIVTSLTDERMGPLEMDLLDLAGDGVDEVIASQFAAGYQGASTPPLYWYTIYRFQDGVPHDVSRQFPSFYKAEVVNWGNEVERLIMPPLGSGSKENNYIEAQIIFTRLRYRRRILGETRAGLEEAAEWADSAEANVQDLAVMTLQEINDPSSISLLTKLTTSKFQGVCRAALGALAEFQHREVTGLEFESTCTTRRKAVPAVGH